MFLVWTDISGSYPSQAPDKSKKLMAYRESGNLNIAPLNNQFA